MTMRSRHAMLLLSFSHIIASTTSFILSKGQQKTQNWIPNPIHHPHHQFSSSGNVIPNAIRPSKSTTTSLSLSPPTPTTLNSIDNQNPTSSYSVAHFGAGCFWSPADALSRLPGIHSVTVGYAGDDTVARTPNYEFICSGRTNLVETVRVEYDPAEITYRALLDEYDKVKKVDKRSKRQYAGVIFVDGDDGGGAMNDEATSWYEEKKRKGDPDADDAASVTIEPMSKTFWVAERYHQNFWGKWRPRIALGVVLLALQSNGIVPYEIVNQVATGAYVAGILAVMAERRFDSKVVKL